VLFTDIWIHVDIRRVAIIKRIQFHEELPAESMDAMSQAVNGGDAALLQLCRCMVELDYLRKMLDTKLTSMITSSDDWGPGVWKAQVMAAAAAEHPPSTGPPLTLSSFIPINEHLLPSPKGMPSFKPDSMAVCSVCG